MSDRAPDDSPDRPGSRILPADPHAAWRRADAKIRAAIERVCDSGRYILGPEVAAFEAAWAAYVGVRHAVGVASGTDAIELALRACGVRSGDLVLTAANTVTATVAAMERAGARLALADVDPETLVLDVPGLAQWLAGPDAPRLRAVVAVHLYGHPVDMPALEALADEHGFVVIEDAAQAHGAVSGGRRVGSRGAAAAFSFYPTKNLPAFGDAGAVTTDDAAIAERARRLRQYGWRERYVAEEPGLNSRLDEMQAAILRVGLEALDQDNARRRAIAERYREELAGIPELVLPVEPAWGRSVWHQFVVRTPRRDALRAHLLARGIHAAVLYPQPIHRQPAYRNRVLVPPGGLPVAERASRELLCLPVHPGLSEVDVERVVAAVRAFPV